MESEEYMNRKQQESRDIEVSILIITRHSKRARPIERRKEAGATYLCNTLHLDTKSVNLTDKAFK